MSNIYSNYSFDFKFILITVEMNPCFMYWNELAGRRTSECAESGDWYTSLDSVQTAGGLFVLDKATTTTRWSLLEGRAVLSLPLIINRGYMLMCVCVPLPHHYSWCLGSTLTTGPLDKWSQFGRKCSSHNLNNTPFPP